jgi:hypothetical protein
VSSGQWAVKQSGWCVSCVFVDRVLPFGPSRKAIHETTRNNANQRNGIGVRLAICDFSGPDSKFAAYMTQTFGCLSKTLLTAVIIQS